MRIAVASGKGGTGKTLVATNLAWVMAAQGHSVAYVDTDVEEPNGHLFLQPKVERTFRLSVPVPRRDHTSCTRCDSCYKSCAFGAISVDDAGQLRVDSKTCHSCGVCMLKCQHEALSEARRELGTVSRGEAGEVEFWSGLLDVGEPRAAPLITGMLKEVKKAHAGHGVLELLDVSPGTSCSAMAATRVADQVVLVTEPTPFGLHDLELAVEMCHAMEQPISVVINRADLGDNRVQEFLSCMSIPLLAELPFSTEVAQAYARKQLAAEQVPDFRRRLEEIARRLGERT